MSEVYTPETFRLRGKEYLSLKDACSIGACSRKDMQTLCVSGKVASIHFDDTLLVEKLSLEEVLKHGDLRRIAAKIEKEEDLWNSNMNQKFASVGVMIAMIAAVFVAPLFLLGDLSSRIDVAAVPSTYNNLSMISEADSGLAASIMSVNESLSSAIADGVLWIFRFVAGIF